jgi:hypothetical protein|nr:MAG TPA: hypothetical protein [Caudoviricetes sp.]
MSILFKRGVVVFSVLILLGTTYVGAISTARPVVISRPPVVKSTPVAKPVTKSSTPKSSTSETKSSTENKTTNVTNNYYTNKSGGFFDSFTGAFAGTWFYHTLFGNNDNSSANTNSDATQENTESGDTDEVFSISYWITNNLEYIKNILFGIK